MAVGETRRTAQTGSTRNQSPRDGLRGAYFVLCGLPSKCCTDLSDVKSSILTVVVMFFFLLRYL